MEAAAPPLEDLRAEVDRIDQAILELLIERTDVVRRDRRGQGRSRQPPARGAAGARGGDPAPPGGARGRALPARGAGAHVARAAGRDHPPADADVGLGVRRPVSTASAPGIWRATISARSRRWSASTARARRCARSATAAPRSRSLPLPNDEDPWWLALISDHHDRLRVFARLPFVADGSGEGEEASALALGRLEPEPSGDDLALLAIEAETGVSRGRLRDLLQGAGLEPVWLAAWRGSDPPQAVHLVEVGSFVREGDERLADVLERGARRGLADRAGRRLPSPSAAGRAPLQGGPEPSIPFDPQREIRSMAKPEAAPRYPGDRALCRRPVGDRRRRPGDQALGQRVGARAEPRRRSRPCRRRPRAATATRTAAPRRCATRSARASGSIRRGSCAAPAPTS